ncbi:hypothetical protein Hanom_Chr12g01156351 [Helianthus anomalus]
MIIPFKQTLLLLLLLLPLHSCLLSLEHAHVGAASDRGVAWDVHDGVGTVLHLCIHF